MRLSRPRVALRAALLAAGGGFMLWRAAEARLSARALDGAEAALASRMALVWALVGALALLAAAAAAALALRPRRRRKSLRLEDLSGGPGPPEPGQ